MLQIIEKADELENDVKINGKNTEIAVILGEISQLIFKCVRNKNSDEKLLEI